jgi:hypothetical protein
MPSWVAVTSVLVTFGLAAGAPVRQPPRDASHDLAELWQAPDDLADRDLLTGPGGTGGSPDADRPFTFVAHKTSGVNPGYDVRDDDGRDWSVKLGEEAQSEVTVSRLLWAIGFHQPPVYYVPAWTLTGTDAGPKPAARFRRNDPGWTADEEWDWYENPFVNSQPFRGLVVAQMLLANWDLKASNNRVYEATDASVTPRRRYIVRDLGSSLGSPKQHPFFAFLGTRGSQGTKNDIAGFERRGFITSIDGSRVEFDYRGLNEELTTIVTPSDVVWTCRLLARLTDAQWDAAFRAGGYAPDIAGRYIAKIKEKIAQGLAPGATSATAAHSRRP